MAQASDERRLRLLESSYDEVLDATKHQDDKIGRLLTVVAFLTAGTLALASLGQGQLLSRRYSVPPFELPLSMISFVMFLMGVFLTVVLLLMALSHPLRIPGLAEARSRRRLPRSIYVLRASQLYFFDIAGLSFEEWKSKWTDDDHVLINRRVRMLVREIHNLAGRTAFKYDRSREAVAVFTASLLFFALTVVLQAFTALQTSVGSSGPLPILWYEKLILSLILVAYIVLVVGAPNRASRQAMEEGVVTLSAAKYSRLTLRVRAERAYILLLSTAVANAVNYNDLKYSSHLWAGVSAGAAVLSVVAFYLASYPDKSSTGAHQKRRGREKKAILVVILLTFPLLGLALWSGYNYHYSGVLAAALGTIGCITLAALIQPTLQMRYRRRRFKRADAYNEPPSADPGGTS